MPNYENFLNFFKVEGGDGTGNGLVASTGYGNIYLSDVRDGYTDGSTDVGDYLGWGYGTFGSSSINLSSAILLGTTPSGVYAEFFGVRYLITSNYYGIGDSLGNLNTYYPYAFCFLGGARIATPKGEVPVEYLQIGHEVLTADGRSVPVKWIGEQCVKNWMFTSCNKEPVCIAAGALGEGLPHSDLYVSGDHGMLVDGYVINACALVNNDTIRFVPLAEMAKEFTYYHIETECHEVVLANGAASETFIDIPGRRVFDNYQQYLDLYGVEQVVPEMDRTRITTARLVPEAVRQRLGAMSPDWIEALDNPDTKLTLKRDAA